MLTSTTIGMVIAAAGGDVGPTQATIIGWVVLASLTLSGLGVNLVSLAKANKSQKREVTFGDAFVTREACSAHEGEVTHRLQRAEHNIAEIWSTMRKEDEATRAEVRKCFQDIERALGRIEGRLNTDRT